MLLFLVISSPPPAQNHPNLPSQPKPSGDDPPDIQILKEVLSHLSSGLLDEEACEDEYDHVKWNTRGDDADLIRGMILSEALAKCLTVLGGSRVGMSSNSVGWFVGKFVEDYWTKLGNRPTQLQRAISIRRITHFSTGILSILSSLPPSTNQNVEHHTPIHVIKQIIHLIENIIIPELHLISSSSSNEQPNHVQKKLKEAKTGVARVVLELLSFGFSGGGNDQMNMMRLGFRNVNPSRWAVGVVIKWYTETGGWKESFEEMLKNFVRRSPSTTQYPHPDNIS